jgi:hypothetical protein
MNAGGAAVAIRKGLVITQFTASIGLIIGTVIVYQQVQHIKDRDLGYTRNNLVYMDLHGDMKDHFDALKDKLLATGYVQDAAISLHDALHVYSYNGNFSWQGKDPSSKIVIHGNDVSPGYLATMQMKLLSGRDFYSTPGIDSNSVIINESLAIFRRPSKRQRPSSPPKAPASPSPINSRTRISTSCSPPSS